MSIHDEWIVGINQAIYIKEGICRQKNSSIKDNYKFIKKIVKHFKGLSV